MTQSSNHYDDDDNDDDHLPTLSSRLTKSDARTDDGGQMGTVL